GVQLLDLDEVLGDIVPLLELQARIARVPFEYSPVGATMRVPIQRDVLAYVLAGLGRDAITAAGTDTPLALSGTVDDDAVRLTLTPARCADAADAEGSAEPPDEALTIADHLMRQIGGRVDLLPGSATRGPAFSITMPLSGA